MKKVYLIPIALVCSLLCVVAVDLHSKSKINSNIEKATYYNNIYTTNCSDYVMDQVINENSIVVLGSSELSSSDNNAYPPSLFNYGYSDFNMIMMGAGYLQSIPQAVNVGALQNNIKNNKVVLIVSPQWFSVDGLLSDQYCSRFEETNFVEFLKNDNISKETRIAVSNRVNELLTSDPSTLERVKKYEEIYLYGTLNPLIYAEMIPYNTFRNARLRYEIAEELESISSSIDYENYVNADSIDWKSLLRAAEKLGEESCTINAYGVYDDYFKKYIENRYEELKNSNVSTSYAISPEYDDLRLFLDVCKETAIEPLIISVPVNGRWYDYCGFSKADRNTYYQNIRNICKAYGVALADFSDKEYELYYLKDIMHMGWKGWVYLDRAVYNFYNDEEIVDTTSYKKMIPQSTFMSEYVEAISEDTYYLPTILENSVLNSVTVTLPYDNTVIEYATDVNHRSGTYLHKATSDNYAIRVAANSEVEEAYIEYNYYLKEGAVYKIEYDVDVLESNYAVVSNFSFSEINY